ncbi:aminotransferase class V-fold PLP-dependent enzyme [Shinella zoogloeoides]|uniref:pyridoxal-phosphate-dependent aminotransferase family protein n=1 Tax=Shinella zoogloeoides TaxID=352475 RepID=UPI0028A750C8|nr:aminotransferase class V-fold PLP-dependent enzyme [Shinella zoogloeoides]
MPFDRWNALNDAPVFPPERFGLVADRLGRILKTRNDILLFQTEAVVALEAVTASLARPGLKAINIVTSPFGAWFGGWLRRGGAEVVTLMAEPVRPIDAEAVTAAFEAHPDTKAVIFCHAESANGVLNPLEEIAAAARARGIVTVVDAVASVGGHALDVDALGVDIAVIGPQKSLAGPAGVSAVSVSPAAWRLVTAEGASRESTLSLLDRKAWLDAGRGALPGTSASLEFFALEAALDRFEAEGPDAVLARHGRAAKAARDGLVALGAAPSAPAGRASHLVTTARLPDGVGMDAFLAAATHLETDMSPGVGPGAENLVRLNHTGQRARFEAVLGNVAAYGIALRNLGLPADIAAAAAAVAAYYSG